MATPPTFIQEAETAWVTTTSPKTTGSVSVQANDVLVAFLLAEEASGRSYALSNGGTATLSAWTQQQLVSTAGGTLASVWTATATASGTLTVTATRTGSAENFGLNVLTFRGSDGVGASAKAGPSAGAPSLGITTGQANSAIVVANGDWNAISATSRTWRTVNGITPTSGNGLEVSFDNSGAGLTYVPYGAYYSDAGAAGAKTVGLSAPAGQSYSIVAVEVKGAAAAGATSLLPPHPLARNMNIRR